MRESRHPDCEGCHQRGASLDPSGYDAGKKVLGRKRHILTDTLGLLLAVSVHPASIQDRDGAEALLRQARRSFPFMSASSATRAIRCARWRLPSPARACGNCKSCAAATSTASSSCRKDGDPRTHPRMDQPLSSARPRLRARHARKAAAFVRLAMIRLMLRRLGPSR
jgi:transposase